MKSYRIQLIRTPIAEHRIELSSPAAAATHCMELACLDREHLLRLDLDTRCQLIGQETVHIGTADYMPVSPRELFRGALLNCARHIVIVHNHPSGSPSPSKEDRNVAAKLKEIGELMDIPLLDFLVIGSDGRYWSIEHGYGTCVASSVKQIDLRTFG
ncbi:MAG: JAB domain-containing protein [Phycisphaeraceae bacterium]